MIERNSQSVVSTQLGEVAETSKAEANKPASYAAPRIYEVGKAIDLLQGIGGYLSDSHASNYRE